MSLDRLQFDVFEFAAGDGELLREFQLLMRREQEVRLDSHDHDALGFDPGQTRFDGGAVLLPGNIEDDEGCEG